MEDLTAPVDGSSPEKTAEKEGAGKEANTPKKDDSPNIIQISDVAITHL